MKIFFKLIFLIFFSAAIGGICFFTTTESGLKLGIQYISLCSPGKLHIDDIKGTFFSEISLQNIFYEDEQQSTSIKSLQFSWNPFQLLQGKILIKQLTLNHANVKIKKSTIDTNRFNYVWLHNITIQQFIVNGLSIHNKEAEITFNGTLSSTWDASWKIHIPHLSDFLANYTGSFSSSGTITGPQLTPLIDASFHAEKLSFNGQQINKVVGKTTLHLRPNQHSKLLLTATDITIKNYSLPKLDLNVSLQVSHKQQALTANIDFLIAQKHRISALLSLPHYTHLFDFTQPIMGKITFNASQLDFLTSSISEIKSPRGILRGDFTLNGTVTDPHLTGEFNLSNGQFVIPKLGVTIEKFTLRTETIINQQIKYDGSFQSGNGTATLQGLIDLSQSNLPISITLQGENLDLVNLPEYKISASPNLKLTFASHQLKMEGELLIPYAEIVPKTFSNTVTLTNDIVFVEEHKKISSLPFTTSMQINLILGDKIHIGYNELQTHLRGKLLITQSPTSLATATGELHAVDGTYRAYGKILSIQEGRLIFTDSQLTNPGLNIRATKQIKTVAVSGTSNFEGKTGLTPVSMGNETVIVGVQIIGSFEKPVVSLFSNPSGLSQTDILSYLILGHSQAQNSGQTSALLSAVSALNAGGTSKLSNLTESIQNKLGLNELNVESTEVFNPNSGSSAPTTSLVVGKELAPNLYVHYSMGLFDPIKILNLRYQLSKRLAIQSETSNMGNGADLLYGIERD